MNFILRRSLVIIIIFCISSFFVSAQPSYPLDWDLKKPLDNDAYCFAVGLSEPCSSEAEAYNQAWRSVLSYFAKSISSYVTLNTQRFLREEGFESDILDTYSLTITHSTWKSEVLISGVKVIAKKVEKERDGKTVVRILGYMTVEDFKKAKIAVQDEETSVLAYSYFEKNVKSDFYGDIETTYTQWIKKNCALFEITDKKEAEKWARQLEDCIKKVYKNVVLYRCDFDECPCVIVYNSSDYLGSIISLLEKAECICVKRLGSTCILSGRDSEALTKFVSYCSRLKDSNKIAVFGVEFYNLPSGEIFENSESRAVVKFRELAQKNFSLIPVSFSQEFESYDDLKTYADENTDDFSARYLVFCTSETEPESYGKKAWVNAYVSFILLDLVTMEEYQSEMAVSMPMSATVTVMSDSQVKAKSRNAIDNACNPDKNPESLFVVMQAVFDGLL
ncbi:MAG: hypothetical protein J5747_10150 [Spirochaetaceae bacterium]|nr:hypothetical protein [Spirochaetaceae bacterium]